MNINNRIFWSHLKTATVTVSVQPVRKRLHAAFQVRNVIDFGFGRQTVFLEALHMEGETPFMKRKNALAIPDKLGNVSFVYTGREHGIAATVYEAISAMALKARMEKIVPDVLAPGDVLVFRKTNFDSRVTNIETFRPMPRSA